MSESQTKEKTSRAREEAETGQSGEGGNGQQSGQAAQLPLFYESVEVLTAERHKDLAIDEERSVDFARETIMVPLNAPEFVVASKNYPIVFVGEDPPMPVAVVGLREGENLFVDDSGKWDSTTYVPAYIRRYPFIFVQRQDGEQLSLAIDTSADSVGQDKANKLFDGDQPSELCTRARDFCVAFHRQFLFTENLGRELRDKGLLATNNSTFSLSNGARIGFNNYRAVDEEQLNALGDDQLVHLHRNGYLAPIYFHLSSLYNWNDLVRRIERRLAE